MAQTTGEKSEKQRDARLVGQPLEVFSLIIELLHPKYLFFLREKGCFSAKTGLMPVFLLLLDGSDEGNRNKRVGMGKVLGGLFLLWHIARPSVPQVPMLIINEFKIWQRELLL